MKITAIICAAGRGERAGFGRNKVLEPLYGAPVLWHTLTKFARADEIIVTASEEDREETAAICLPFGAKIVQGGRTRAESVGRALEAACGEIALIHDGARPFVSGETICGCIESVKKYGSGICAVPATDTAAITDGGEITEIPDRADVFLLQTPQGFYTDEIRRAYRLSASDGAVYTDDSSVYAAYIGRPHVCNGDRNNVKLTFRQDFNRDERGILAGQSGAIGFGVDVHAFGCGTYVTLCGVRIPCDGALVAHSDGDVAAHAVSDALLSAAGLKDIGHYFPDTDVKWLGADSMQMLSETVKIIYGAGYAPANLSLSVQAERPRLAKHIDGMKANLAAALKIPQSCVAVAAGTCEGLGFVGEGRGIAAYAAVTVKEV